MGLGCQSFKIAKQKQNQIKTSFFQLVAGSVQDTVMVSAGVAKRFQYSHLGSQMVCHRILTSLPFLRTSKRYECWAVFQGAAGARASLGSMGTPLGQAGLVPPPQPGREAALGIDTSLGTTWDIGPWVDLAQWGQWPGRAMGAWWLRSYSITGAGTEVWGAGMGSWAIGWVGESPWWARTSVTSGRKHCRCLRRRGATKEN